MMTFEQFQTSGRYCGDLGKALDDASFDDADGSGQKLATGRIYGDPRYPLYIESTKDWETVRSNGNAWYLILERDEYLSNDLPQLERLLYDFAVTSGYLD